MRWLAFTLALLVTGGCRGTTAVVRADASGAPIRGRVPHLALAPRVGFRHWDTRMFVTTEAPLHRGRDAFVRVGDPAWVVARFAYGLPARALRDEDVDIYLLRGRQWDLLGTARTVGRGTTATGPDGTISHEEGLVSFRVPDTAPLGVGLHRVRLVVRGDHTMTDVFLDVIPPDAHFVVTDVDGTLTESEAAGFLNEVGLHGVPAANPGAAAVLRALAARGERILYLTARPEWTMGHTRAWLTRNGFPPGLVHERSDLDTGLFAREQAAYKTRALREVVQTFGRLPDFAFGNTSADTTAYGALGVPADRQFYFRLAGNVNGGERIDDYRPLIERVGRASSSPSVSPSAAP